VVRVEAAAPPAGWSEAVEVAEHERSLELLQLERRSGETQTETISIAVSSMGAGVEDVAEARDVDLIVVGGAHRSGVGRVLAGDDERSVLQATISPAIRLAPLVVTPATDEKRVATWHELPDTVAV
jgi:nucleotide-binding universal stress UspA family protein